MAGFKFVLALVLSVAVAFVPQAPLATPVAVQVLIGVVFVEITTQTRREPETRRFLSA